MNTLPADIITYIGQFLDKKTRRTCLESAQCFHSINYTYKQHHVFVNDENIDKLSQTIDYIKRIKPCCETIMFVCKKNKSQVFNQHASSFQLNMRYAASHFKIALYLTQIDIETMLEIIPKDVVFDMIYIQFRNDEESEHLEQLFDDVQCLDLQLIMYENQVRLLNAQDIMSKVTHIVIVFVENHVKQIDLQHLSHVSKLVCDLNDNETRILNAKHITHLYLRDMLWETDDGHLLNSFDPNDKDGRLKEVWMMDLIKDTKMYHAYNNFWYRVIQHFKSSCEFHYTALPTNVLVPVMLKKMIDIGAQNLKYAYFNDDTFILSKFIEEFVPKLAGTTSLDTFNFDYNEPDHLVKLQKHECYQHLSPETRQLWYFLEKDI